MRFGAGLTNGSARPVLPAAPPPPPSDYLQRLRSLNTSVSEWISQHVRENPYVDLTPIFRDYEAHLSGIDARRSVSTSPSAGASESTTAADDKSVSSASEGVSCPTPPAPPLTYTCLLFPPPEEVPQQPTPATAVKEEEEKEEGEREAVREEQNGEERDGVLLSLRCKLFYKKDESYVELGVGALAVEGGGGGARRLLIRNDTAMRSVLLNIRVTPDTPLSLRKNNVVLVSPPNPPLSSSPAPVTYLLRVKTTTEAERLLATLKP